MSWHRPLPSPPKPSEAYHRRSRSGCVTCRAARIKCDEARPSCLTCATRGADCKGYAKTLKWINAGTSIDFHVNLKVNQPTTPTTPGAEARDVTGANSGHGTLARSSSQEHQPSPVQLLTAFGLPTVTTDRDMLLLQYWTESVAELAFPYPQKYSDIRNSHLSLVFMPGSVLLPVALAGASSLLLVSGRISEMEQLAKKQSAIRALSRAVGLSSHHEDEHPSKVRPSPDDWMAGCVAAAVNYVGMEIIQGSSLDVLLPLIRGAVFLAIGRQKNVDESVSPFGPFMEADIKLLAWHDIMTCIPYPRKSFFPSEYWEKVSSANPVDSSCPEPDIVFGYAAPMLAIIASCAICVRRFFDGLDGEGHFKDRRGILLHEISRTKEAIPLAHLGPEHPRRTSSTWGHDACVHAAAAHACATEIYLRRATDFSRDSPIIRDLVSDLASNITRIPWTNPTITMMLWPLWVLGCETYENGTRRELILTILQQMLDKQDGTVAGGNSELSLFGGQVATHLGFVAEQGMEADLLSEAVTLAGEADIAICFVGNTVQWKPEGQDLETMRLPANGSQDALIASVAAANSNTIVVLTTGVPVELPWLDDVGAVLQAWYAGQESDNAIVDVLVGDVTPSGKLPVSWPKKIEDTASFGNFGLDSYDSCEVEYVEGVYVGYRHFDRLHGTEKKVRFSFGHGLSYTTFEVDNVKLVGSLSSKGGRVPVSATVKNTGLRKGAETVQIFLAPPPTSQDRPQKALVAFEKVHLAPDETCAVSLSFAQDAAARWDDRPPSEGGHSWRVGAGNLEVIVARSSNPADVWARLTLTLAEDLSFAA